MVFGIDDAVTAVSGVVGKIIDRAWPDPTEAAKQKIETQKMILDALGTIDQQQSDVNKVEAASPHWFVAAWRPAIGWVCAIAMATYYWPKFFIGTVLWIWACYHAGGLVPQPDLGITEILGLVMPLLGMGGLRSLDKYLGVATTAMVSTKK